MLEIVKVVLPWLSAEGRDIPAYRRSGRLLHRLGLYQGRKSDDGGGCC
ncbi:hypothetical protein [Cognatishimia activa]|nr:hypothetical protein [Cognatishimia activa]